MFAQVECKNSKKCPREIASAGRTAVKEVAGNPVGNETTEAKGKIQKTLGEAQAKFGGVKKDLKDTRKTS